ncbi:Hpt domain-containing protein [Desulfovulcanus sp.]
MAQDFFDPEIFADFVIEAREHLETIEPKLLDLEKDPENLSLIDEIFRPMHSLKGASGFLGLNVINALAHKGENILDELRKGRMKLTPRVMDVILEAFDALREMIDNLESQGSEGDVDVEPIIRDIEALLAGEEDVQDQESEPSDGPEEKAPQVYALTIISNEHLQDFLEEAREIIETINTSLLELENEVDNQELVADIFRYFHNLKGNSGIIGYKELNAVTHAAETLLNRVRNGEIKVTHALIDVLLSAVDMMGELIEDIDQENGQVKSRDVSEIISRLEKIDALQKEVSEGNASDVKSSQDEKQEGDELDIEVDDEDVQIFEQTVKQQFDNIALGLDKLKSDPDQKDIIDGLYRALVSIQNSASYMGLDDLKKYAEQTANLVDQGRKSDLDFSLMLDLLEQEVGILKDMVEEKLGLLKKAKKKVEDKPEKKEVQAPEKKQEQISTKEEKPAPAPKPARQPQSKPSAGKQKSGAQMSSTIRVDHSKLDHLMNLIGELIITRNRFAMLARELEEGKDVADISQKITETTYAMARISDDLQVTIMNVRMVPVKSVFNRFPRLVRDLSRKSGKKVELITEGEETELDKSVIELIGDPLVHLIRNAVDHGLETEEERRAAGKSPTGKVWLRAAHKGNSVIIEVEDDGRGIDPDKMRAKGVEKGILTEEEAQNMDDHHAIELIFAPGFSTAEKVTDISGRGVGMDVVRNNIKSLKGSINVQSVVGRGTKFTISLPLTLAIIEALLVKVDNDTYAIPLDAVSETTKIEAERLSEVNKRKAITLRGEVLGIVELAELLDLPVEKDDRQILPIVIITVNDRRLGLVVDTLLERQEIVIKSLGQYLGDLPGISGATIMGDGNVVLILDPHEIYRLATSQATLKG